MLHLETQQCSHGTDILKNLYNKISTEVILRYLIKNTFLYSSIIHRIIFNINIYYKY